MEFEDKSMAETTPPIQVRLTGSTGLNALQDSGIRGIIAGALGGILAFLQIEYDLISADGAAALVPVILFAAFILGGLYDKFIKPRIASS